MKKSARQPAKRKEPGLLLPHTDFDGAFTAGTVFLEGKQEYEMETLKWGTLVVPSGRIVASDVLMDPSRTKPFERVVPQGKYPVTIAWNGFANCAMAVRFSSRKAVRWEAATRIGETRVATSQSDPPCFGVDSGMAGFFDAEAAQIAARNENWNAQFDTSQHSITIDHVSRAGMVWCFSGHGDGAYPCYWGLDGSGTAVCLVADFLVLVEGVHDVHVITELYDKVGSELADPWFSQFDCTKVRLQWNKKKNEFRFEYRCARDLFEVELLNGKGKRAGLGGVSGAHGIPGDSNCIQYMTRVFNVMNDKKAMLRIKAFGGVRALRRKA